MGTVRATVSRWFLPFLGVISAATVLGFVVISADGPFLGTVFEGLFAIVLACVLSTVGYRYYTTTNLPDRDPGIVALGAVAGVGLLAVMNLWFRLIELSLGEIEPRFAALTSLTAGALGGGVVGIALARARRRHAEREQALADYSELFETAEDGIFIHDPDTGEILEVNDRGAEMLGYTTDELEGLSVEAMSADDPAFDQAQAMQKIERAKRGNAQQFDWLLERSDGRHLWVEVALKRATLGGEPRLIAFVRDISDRKEYERELERAEKRFRSLAENTSFGVITIDETSTIQYANNAMTALLGYTPDALTGDSLTTIMPERYRSQHEAGIARYLDEGTRTVDWSGIEFPGLHAEGHEVPLEIGFGELAVGDEQLFTGVLRDITERKAYERELAARSEAMEASIDGIAILDEDGVYRFVNQAHADIYGYADPAAMVGETWHMCYEEAELDRFEAEVMPTLFDAGAWRGEAVGLREDGSTFPQELSLSATNDGGLVCVVRDVTERKTHERHIANLHEATREMVQATDEQTVCDIAVRTAETLLDLPMTAIWLADESGERLEPLSWSDRAEDLFGEQPVYTEGNSLSWRAYSTGETFEVNDLQSESELLNPDTILKSELVIPLGEYGVLNTGSTEPGAYTENDIAIVKLLAANTQVALERVERERELRRQNDQMEFFNSILRHDVLNGITVIRGRGQFLTDELEGDQLRDAETIVTWSNDIVQIIQRVRTVLETLTGERDTQLEPMDVGAVLGDEVSRLRSTYPAVTFELRTPAKAPVLANELLGDVVGNVITNAIEHNDTDGLRVSITVETDEETVTVSVADNGQGVSDDRKIPIFRRGETGHAKATGSGFGLFFVDAMMDEYGGDVWVTDNDAGGATFVLQFQSVSQSTDQ